MFWFNFKKSVISPVIIIIIVITSLFLISEFYGYFTGFPIENQADLEKLAKVGSSTDFVKRLYAFDTDTQLQKIYKYYTNIVETDSELSILEKNIIQNKILTSKNYDEFMLAYTDLFFEGAKHGMELKHQNYLDILLETSGESYQDVNRRIKDSLKENKISYFFALRFSDRLMMIFMLSIFVFTSFRFYAFNQSRMEGLFWTKSYSNIKYIIVNYIVEIFILLLIAGIQMLLFAFIMNLNLGNNYSVSLSDYVWSFCVLIIPSFIVLISILFLLNHLFNSVMITFPIYFIIGFLSSKIVPELGYTINKSNLIIRYDTLFEPLSKIELYDLTFNRVLMLFISVLFIIFSTLVYNMRRNGVYQFKFPKIWGK